MKTACAILIVFLIALSGGSVWSENLAVNPGFEDTSAAIGAMPSYWNAFQSHKPSIENVDNIHRTGNRCVLLKTQGESGAYLGLIQRFPVQGGQSYSWIAHIRRNTENPLGGGAYGLLVIEWIDDDGFEITRTESAKWTYEMSAYRWDKVGIENVTAPLQAREAVFGIHLVDGEDNGRGSFYLDDVAIEQQQAR